MSKVEDIRPYDGNDGKTEQVRRMFNGIAPTYDRLNGLMSMGLYRLWLRRLTKEVTARKPARILDMATGTGDVAVALARKLPKSTITGLDLSDAMMDQARSKAIAMGVQNISFGQADCTATGLEDESIDAITVAYGIRNFADIRAGIAEAYRLLRPGGSFYILELSQPKGLLKPFYKLYTRYAVPLMGKFLSGDKRAYSYLPESIAACPARHSLKTMLTDAGFVGCSYTSLSFGVCTLYRAFKPLK